MRNTESLQFAESRPQGRTYSYTHQFMLFQTLRLLRFSAENKCFSGSRVPSRLGADTTSTPPAAAAAAVAGLESTKGSAPGATSGSTEPKSSVVQAASSIVLTVSLPVSLSPLSSCSVCLLCSSCAVNFDEFPPFYEALL